MKLLIVESPNKCKKIASILGAGWRVEASVGHVRDLPLKEIGVAAPAFEPKYEPTERGRQVIAKLRKAVAEADETYLATDPDREGEAISWHLKEALHLKNPKRVTFNEITAGAVKAAIASPRVIDSRLVEAQEARRVLDRLVGYMVSPALRAKTGSNLTAGRVQSPALRLVVEREREIANFKPKVHFGVRLHFAGDKGDWHADWNFKPLLGKPAAGAAADGEEEVLWLDKSFADKIATIRDVVVTDLKESESTSAPPPPFTTSTLQQAASASLGMSPDATMAAAQELFAAGHISYHRTDSPGLSKEAVESIREFLQSKGMPLVPTPRKWKSKEGAQEAHEGIRPTHIELEEAGSTDEQKRLYRLIRNRVLASEMADARFAVRTVLLESAKPVDGKKIGFKGVGKTLIFAGWQKLTGKDAASEDDEEPDNPVPKLAKGTALTAKRGELQQKTTKAPARYTEASLIKKLETEGIGRPSTYAAILTGLKKRGYIDIQKKRMVPTGFANTIVDALTSRFSFIDLPFTRNMEEHLDHVAEGKETYLGVVTACHERLVKELKDLGAAAIASSGGGARQSSPGEEPVFANITCSCGNTQFRRVKGRFGFFWGCTQRECKETRPDENGKPGEKRERAALPPQPEKPVACPGCGKTMILRNGSRGPWYGCQGFPNCRVTANAGEDGKPIFREGAASAPAAKGARGSAGSSRGGSKSRARYRPRPT